MTELEIDLRMFIPTNLMVLLSHDYILCSLTLPYAPANHFQSISFI